MSTVDERIVKMEFDNREFESKAQTTINTLDDLNKSLDFSAAQKNLENFSSATNDFAEKTNKGFDNAGKSLNNFNQTMSSNTFSDFQNKLNNFNISPVSNAFQTLTDQINNLGVVGTTVLANLTSKATDAALGFTKAFTIEPISGGMQKYQNVAMNEIGLYNQYLNMDYTQEDIKKAVEQLQLYSDWTSADLDTMTTAMIAFAQAAIPIEDAIPTIMGIGNSITYAGRSMKDNAGAFTTIANAIQGNMTKIQWDQLTRTYKITSRELKQYYLDAAESVGTLKKIGDGVYKTEKGLEVTLDNFETTINAEKGKWITGGVVLEVYGNKYGQFSDQVTRYAMAVQELENRTLTYTEASEEYNKKLEENGYELDEFGIRMMDSATFARNYAEAIDAVKDAVTSSWRGIFENILGDAWEAIEFWTTFSDVLNKIATTPLNFISEAVSQWASLKGRADIFDKDAGALHNLGEAINSILEPIKNAANAVFRFKSSTLVGNDLKVLTHNFNEWTKSLKLTDEQSEKLQRTFESLFKVIKVLGTGVEKIITLFKNIVNVFSPLLKVVKKIGDVFISFFNAIVDKFDIFDELNSKLDKTANIFEVLGTAISDAVDWIIEKLDKFEEIGLNAIDGFGSGFIDGAAKVLNTIIGWFNSLVESIKKFLGIASPSKLFSDIATWCVEGFAGTFHELMEAISDDIVFDFQNLFGKIKDAVTTFTDATAEFFKKENLSTMANGIVDFFWEWGSRLGNLLGEIFKAIGDKINNLNIEITWDQIIRIAEGGFIASVILNINDLISKLSTVVGKFIKGIDFSPIIKSITGQTDKIGNSVAKFFKSLQNRIDFGTIKLVAIAIALLAGSLWLLSKIPADDLDRATTALIDIAGALALVMAVMGNAGLIGGASGGLGKGIAGAAAGIGKGVGLAGVIAAFAVLALSVAGSLKILQSVTLDESMVEKIAKMLEIIGAIALAIAGMSALGAGTASAGFGTKGGKGFSGSFAKDNGNILKTAEALAVGCAALLIVAKAIEKVAAVQVPQGESIQNLIDPMISAIVSIAACLGVLNSIGNGSFNLGSVSKQGILKNGGSSGKFDLASSTGNIMKTALALDVAVGSLLIVAKAVEKVAGITVPEETSIKDLLSPLIEAIGMITLCISAMSVAGGSINFGKTTSFEGASVLECAVGILLGAISLSVVAGAVNKIAEIGDPEAIRKATNTLSILMGVITLCLGILGYVTAFGGDLIKSAAAMAIVAVAMNIMALAVAEFVGLYALGGPKGLWSAIAAIAALFAVLVLAGVIATPAAAGLGALAAVLAAFGFAVVAATVAIAALGPALILLGSSLLIAAPILKAGLIALIESFSAVGEVLIMNAPTILNSISALLLYLIPGIIRTILQGFASAIVAIAEGIGPILESIITLIITIIDELANKVRQSKEEISAAFWNLVTAVFELLWQVVQDGWTMFVGWLSEQAWWQEIVANWGAVKEAFAEWWAGIEEQFRAIGVAWDEYWAGIRQLFQDLGQGFVDLFDWIGQSITNWWNGVVQWWHNVQQAFEYVRKILRTIGTDLIQGLLDGLTEGIKWIRDLVTEIADKGIIQTIRDRLGVHSPSTVFKEIGKNLIQGLIDGIKSMITSVANAVKSVADTAINKIKGFLGIQSPSRVFRQLGEYTGEGFILGIENMSTAVGKASEEMAENCLESATKPLESLQDYLDSDMDTEFVITPVLDFSQIQNGSKLINSMLPDVDLNGRLGTIQGNIDTNYLVANQLAALKDQLMSMNENGLTSESIGEAVRSSLEGMGVYMDRSRVGKMVNTFNSNTGKAIGV